MEDQVIFRLKNTINGIRAVRGRLTEISAPMSLHRNLFRRIFELLDAIENDIRQTVEVLEREKK